MFSKNWSMHHANMTSCVHIFSVSYNFWPLFEFWHIRCKFSSENSLKVASVTFPISLMRFHNFKHLVLWCSALFITIGTILGGDSCQISELRFARKTFSSYSYPHSTLCGVLSLACCIEIWPEFYDRLSCLCNLP